MLAKVSPLFLFFDLVYFDYVFLIFSTLDNRFYFLDFARAMPSDNVKRHKWFQDIPNAPLVCRFRPEFLSNYSR